ncbi:MAG: hypothetical protein LBD93_11905 [Treponema sp.]|nr:hypothetical protein [Treponema sp.]
MSDPAAFAEAVSAVNASREGNYTIILSGSFAAAPVAFAGGAAKTITLRGEDADRTITNNGNAAFFTVPANSTLVLDGNKKKELRVYVNGGTLTMKAGLTQHGSNSAAGPGDNLDSGVSGKSGGWE